MRTAKVLHNLLARSVPSIHAARLNSVIASVQALTQGARATVTSVGIGLMGKAYDKHKIKRVDRLLSNQAHNQGVRHDDFKSLMSNFTFQIQSATKTGSN